MKRLMVMAVTCVAVLGCAASQYKFTCNASNVCEVETAGPATLDFEDELGETLEIVETADDRVTMRAGSAEKTFKTGETGRVGPIQVTVKNIKGENAFFTARP